MGTARVLAGDCVDVLRTLPDCSVDAVVTDPPYGLEFMGAAWDNPKMLGQMATGHELRGAFAYGGTHSRGYADNDGYAFQAWCYTWATEVFRVLKPGGHMVAFGGTRTWHRLTTAVEDAGFEIRDTIMWLYGSGMPKSHNVSKAIDKLHGAERPVVRQVRQRGGGTEHVNRVNAERHGYRPDGYQKGENVLDVTVPATDDAARWDGWGTGLKPAVEPAVLARKPLSEGTVAGNVLHHGTGALHIDACRTDLGFVPDEGRLQRQSSPTAGMAGLGGSGYSPTHVQPMYNTAGRWPANVTLDEAAAAELDTQSGVLPPGNHPARRGGNRSGGVYALGHSGTQGERRTTDAGGASRFFYVAKAPKKERPTVGGVTHPTVKPLTLMRWLVRLVTPPGGTVLDPFAGSGTTVEAALLEGFDVIAVEKMAEYVPLIEFRIARANQASVEGAA